MVSPGKEASLMRDDEFADWASRFSKTGPRLRMKCAVSHGAFAFSFPPLMLVVPKARRVT